ncbi:MAG: hypothetical protein QMC28_03210, partial [Flavobacteriales bacterium]
MITSLFKNDIFSYLLASIIGVVLWGIAYFEVILDISVSINIANQEFFFSKQTAILFSFFVTLFGATLL